MVSSTERSARLSRARASSAAARAGSICASVVQPLARRSLARCSEAAACASTPVAARNSASACSACSFRSTSSRVASGWPTSTVWPTSTRRFATLPGTRKPMSVSIRGLMVPTKLRSGDSGFVMHRRDQNRASRGGLFSGLFVAAGQRESPATASDSAGLRACNNSTKWNGRTSGSPSADDDEEY